MKCINILIFPIVIFVTLSMVPFDCTSKCSVRSSTWHWRHQDVVPRLVFLLLPVDIVFSDPLIHSTVFSPMHIGTNHLWIHNYEPVSPIVFWIEIVVDCICYCTFLTWKWQSYFKSRSSGAHLGGRGIHHLPSKRKVSLNRPFASKMPLRGLKCPA